MPALVQMSRLEAPVRLERNLRVFHLFLPNRFSVLKRFPFQILRVFFVFFFLFFFFVFTVKSPSVTQRSISLENV